MNIFFKEKIKRDYFIQLLIYIILINLIYYFSFKIFKKELEFTPFSSEITKIKIKDGKFAKIGIISDFQLDRENNNIVYQYYSDNVYQALKIFKKNNIDILLIAGDITNNGHIINYLHFKKIFYSVYNNYKKPTIISVMGNNDYRDKKFTKIENQKKLFNYIKAYPYSHYIINNYNFIFWSNDNSSSDEKGIEDYTWIKLALEKARKNLNKKGDPIFVITHMPPKGTVYGSELFHKGIYDILKNYPEVICISGHSHHSLKNIKSIWQGEFTVINTQSLSYTAIDNYFENKGDTFLNSAKNGSMGLIAHLNKENIIFDRIEFCSGEKYGESWKIDFPVEQSKFIYQFDKRNKKIKPVFQDKNEIKIEKDTKNGKNDYYINFKAAFHEDYVYSYKIVLKKKDKKDVYKELYYYSDYYKNKLDRKEILKFHLPNDIKKGIYDIEIYAIDSFENISNPIIGIIEI